jgi:RNA polymerase sigma-70 factor, ECF subfamily
VSTGTEALDRTQAEEPTPDFETTFRAQYARMARFIARVVRDSARAEELAVEVFLKLWRHPQAQRENAEAWLYRAAMRTGLDELRRRTRRERYERRLGLERNVPTPEEIHAASEEQRRVCSVLAALERRQSELLLLRSHDFRYDEMASVLGVNRASVGTLLARAQQAFRKEYLKRYGNE